MTLPGRTALVSAVLAEAALLFVITNPAHPLHRPWILPWEAGAGCAFAVAVLLLRKLELRWRTGLAVIVGVTVLLDLIAMLSAPTSTDDDFRYAWDAKVQLHGIDPYHYAPADPALAHLRDSFTFSHAAGCGSGRLVPLDGCALINRPFVHTIYPPVAQLAFVVMRLASLGRAGHLPFQLGAAAAGLGVTLLLARQVRRGRAQWWQVALWAWCPITVLELANDAHIEGLAVLLSVAAVLAGAGGRDRAAGLWAGAATAVKLYPVLVLPALMRRRPVLVAGSAAGLVVLSYLPHVAAVGKAVVGYLPGYLQEENYGSGGRFLLLNLVIPDRAAEPAAVLILALTAWLAWRRTDPDRPEQAALWMVGIFFLVATPSLSWYSLLLLALCALAGRPEWLGVVAAPSLIYLDAVLDWTWIGPCSYLAAGLLLAVVTLGRKSSYGWWSRPNRDPNRSESLDEHTQ